MRAGLTQADVAERVGIATEVYGRLERGRMLPSVPTLWRLCLVLCTSSDEFLGLVQAQTNASEPRPPFVGDDSSEADERPEMRRLMRSLRKLSRPELKLMNLVAGAIHFKR
jgi:transcriptional regulator with XRE-family HTH domain